MNKLKAKMSKQSSGPERMRHLHESVYLLSLRAIEAPLAALEHQVQSYSKWAHCLVRDTKQSHGCLQTSTQFLESSQRISDGFRQLRLRGRLDA